MEYSVTEKQVILNFSKKFCNTEIEILNSSCFYEVWENFIKKSIKIKNQNVIKILSFFEADNGTKELVDLFRHLLVFSIEEIKITDEKYKAVLEHTEELAELVQDFYDYWRRLERIALTFSRKNEGVDALSFIGSQTRFNDLVLKLYRFISEKIYDSKYSIYRQLPAGVNAQLMVTKNRWMKKNSSYSFLEKANAIEQILIRPPYIIYTEKNKRTGIYQETKKNPLRMLASNFDASQYYCFQTMVGAALTYVYFHKNFLAMGIAIANLFEFIPASNVKEKKPDCIYIFGVEMEGDSVFYYDKDNDIYLGIAPLNSSVDYFGYVKKMMLTLYNVKMIAKGNLPLHGACVHLTLSDGRCKNIVIIGDSGAGKSESLEALAAVAGDDISSSLTVFDDMGTLKYEDGEIKAYGTEIGAFVRLDDMTAGYAYKEMDRAIFINPDRTNSRLVIPVSTHEQIMKGYKVDMLLYANNFEEDVKRGINFFSNVEAAKETFIRGARKAKGTTQEYGLVESFFANPFGPVQKEKETRKLIDLYFDKLYKDGIPIGTLYTRLAVSGMEQEGPKFAAIDLLKLVKE